MQKLTTGNLPRKQSTSPNKLTMEFEYFSLVGCWLHIIHTLCNISNYLKYVGWLFYAGNQVNSVPGQAIGQPNQVEHTSIDFPSHNQTFYGSIVVFLSQRTIKFSIFSAGELCLHVQLPCSIEWSGWAVLLLNASNSFIVCLKSHQQTENQPWQTPYMKTENRQP